MATLKRMAMVAVILATAAAKTTANTTTTTTTTVQVPRDRSRAIASSSDAGRASSSSSSSSSATLIRRRSMTRGRSNDGDENDVGVEDYGRHPSDQGAGPSSRLVGERANGDEQDVTWPLMPPPQSSPATGSDDGTMRPLMVKGTSAAEQRELAIPGVIPIRGPRNWNSDRPSRFVDYSQKRVKTDKGGGERGGSVGGEKRVFNKENRLSNMWMRNRQGGKSGKSSKKHGGWYYDECYDLPPKYDP